MGRDYCEELKKVANDWHARTVMNDVGLPNTAKRFAHFDNPASSDSGSCTRKGVGVRGPASSPTTSCRPRASPDAERDPSEPHADREPRHDAGAGGAAGAHTGAVEDGRAG